MDNKDATLHLLTLEESEYFKQVNARIEEIKKCANLDGLWVISDNFKWLVKVEE